MVINKSQPYKIYISTLFHSKIAFSKTQPSKAANKPYITSIWHNFNQTFILLDMIKWWVCQIHLCLKFFFLKKGWLWLIRLYIDRKKVTLLQFCWYNLILTVSQYWACFVVLLLLLHVCVFSHQYATVMERFCLSRNLKIYLVLMHKCINHITFSAMPVM